MTIHISELLSYLSSEQRKQFTGLRPVLTTRNKVDALFAVRAGHSVEYASQLYNVDQSELLEMLNMTGILWIVTN